MCVCVDPKVIIFYKTKIYCKDGFKIFYFKNVKLNNEIDRIKIVKTNLETKGENFNFQIMNL